MKWVYVLRADVSWAKCPVWAMFDGKPTVENIEEVLDSNEVPTVSFLEKNQVTRERIAEAILEMNDSIEVDEALYVWLESYNVTKAG